MQCRAFSPLSPTGASFFFLCGRDRFFASRQHEKAGAIARFCHWHRRRGRWLRRCFVPVPMRVGRCGVAEGSGGRTRTARAPRARAVATERAQHGVAFRVVVRDQSWLDE